MTPTPSTRASELFYIQNRGYCGNSLIWWKSDRCGYTTKLDEALIVDKTESDRICSSREGGDIARPVGQINSVARLQVCCEDLLKAKS